MKAIKEFKEATKAYERDLDAAWARGCTTKSEGEAMLKIGIAQVGSIVLGRVIEQDIEESDARLVTIANNRHIRYIESCSSPELRDNVLYIRGGNIEYDDVFFARKFPTAMIAKEVIEDIKRLVRKVNHPEDTPLDEAVATGLTVIE